MNKIIITMLAVACFVSMFLLNACSDDDGPDIGEYNEAMLKNVYNNGIVPVHENFVEESYKLDSLAKKFVQDQQLTTFERLRTQWVNTTAIWNRCQMYNFGPVSMSFIHYRIDKWHGSYEDVEAHIASTAVLNNDFIEASGSNVKGLDVIQYLLFENGSSSSAVLDNYMVDANGARRGEYLTALTANLYQQAGLLMDMWGAYEEQFKSELGGGVNSSQNRLVNALVGELERVVEMKLGRPLGKSSGGTAQPESAEAYASEASFSLLTQNLMAIKQCYTGEFATADEATGFDDLLDKLGSAKLSVSIKNQVDICLQEIEEMNEPLSQAVVNHPAQVENLYTSCNTLLGMIKVDMANVLGATITFTDNDGD